MCLSDIHKPPALIRVCVKCESFISVVYMETAELTLDSCQHVHCFTFTDISAELLLHFQGAQQ